MCQKKHWHTLISFPVYLIVSSKYKIRKGGLHKATYFAFCYFITTFGHGNFGKLSDIRIGSDYESKLREAGIIDQDLRTYGIASEIGCLTISEAAKLNRMVNGRAKRASSSVNERFSSLRQEHSAVPAVAEEVSRNEKREQMRLVPSANNRPVLRR